MPFDDATALSLRRFCAGFRWEGVELLAYKPEADAPFRNVTRQVLFADPPLACELRYFEVAPSGYSSLERHNHAHAVLILRGAGHVLVGDSVQAVATHDLVRVPPWTWHQFRAARGEPLGFLCMVNRERDKPQLPTAEELAALRANPAVAAFLDGGSAF